MSKKLSEAQVQAILEALDKAIDDGPWDSSNFLQVVGQKLQDIRNRYAEKLKKDEEPRPSQRNKPKRVIPEDERTEVFISLYSSDGSKLQSWERIIINLPSQVVSRPVYGQEKNAQAAIRSKESTVNEAYAAFFVSKNDLIELSTEKQPVDKLGQPLLTLKNKSIDLSNLNKFVHQSVEYKYHKGRLIKKDGN